jgi:hypothetical protein
LDDCDVVATCTNATGTFACACPEGYRGTGTTCTDIDECAEALDDCAANATCTNAPGTFQCACPEGYRGDGRTCVAAVSDYAFTGAEQTWISPVTGNVTLEVWGAQGGGGNSGLGGYARGTLSVAKGDTLHVFVGERPSGSTGGWNGGGSSFPYNDSVGSGGGGASDIRLGGTALSNRIIVAGGGGAGSGHIGGAGSGANGVGGSAYPYYSDSYCGQGATRSAGGTGGVAYPGCGSPSQPGASGTLGQGGNGGRSGVIGWGDGGGGGYFGGGGAGGACTGSFSGGGGSGYTDPSISAVTTSAGVRSGHGAVRITLP